MPRQSLRERLGLPGLTIAPNAPPTPVPLPSPTGVEQIEQIEQGQIEREQREQREQRGQEGANSR